ncbi:MAG: phosphinothricin acetyltransferase [SAR86 cluster bacterium]|uniref:Phosphinothricin acetyltransferase n=1 Tax=SAR86 cluster bacterium TaxID=2030880 RepID=A0A2A5B5C5_9GAMM|nr:MAG: phosphinothricin acetyltransferase [SAR86 cluster bacterium]
METLVIRDVTRNDSEAVASIYNWYIENTYYTFEENAVSALDMAIRIEKITSQDEWLVAELKGVVVGFAYAAPWKARDAYKYSRETTVYLDRQCFGQGIGRKLYLHLIDELRKSPIHVLIAGIALPNEGSVAVHESVGFKKTGQFHEVGFKFNKYVDVAYWQLNL